MSVSSVLAAGRRAAEARMTSRVTIRRLTGGPPTTVNGYEVPAWSTPSTAVPFRLQGGSTKTVTVGGVEFQEATAIGHLPAGTDLADGDLLEITAGEWVGSVFRVVEAVKGDQQTARRVPVVEVPRPEEWS